MSATDSPAYPDARRHRSRSSRCSWNCGRLLRLPTLDQIDQVSGVRIFLCTAATDMRRGFDRLAAMVEQSLRQDPLSGNLFVFRNRGGDKLKILYWDKDGFCIWYKRLEEGSFRFPREVDGQESIEVRASELAILLEGIDLRSIKRIKRFQRRSAEPSVASQK